MIKCDALNARFARTKFMFKIVIENITYNFKAHNS